MRIRCVVIPILALCAGMAYGGFSARQVCAEMPKRFAFNDTLGFAQSRNYHGGAGTVAFKELFGTEEYKTGHLALRLGKIPPRCGIGEYRPLTADELYIIITGEADITVNGRTGKVFAGSMVPCKRGESIGLFNASGEEVLIAWLITAEKPGPYQTADLGGDLKGRICENPCPFPAEYMRKWVAPDGSRSHEGKGVLKGCNGKYDFDYFQSRFIAQFMVLPADCSIGYHGHRNVEEVYLLMNGKARGTVNDVTRDMKTGDATLCSIGDAHGIYNNGTEDLFIFYTAKLLNPGGEFDSENLNDDLSTR